MKRLFLSFPTPPALEKCHNQKNDGLQKCAMCSSDDARCAARNIVEVLFPTLHLEVAKEIGRKKLPLVSRTSMRADLKPYSIGGVESIRPGILGEMSGYERNVPFLRSIVNICIESPK